MRAVDFLRKFSCLKSEIDKTINEMGIQRKVARRRLIEGRIARQIVVHIILITHVGGSAKKHWLQELENFRNTLVDWNIGPKGKIGNYTEAAIIRALTEKINTKTDIAKRLSDIKREHDFIIAEFNLSKVASWIKTFASSVIRDKSLFDIFD